MVLGPREIANHRKYSSGAIGSLTHSLLLHGEKYETQLSVFADGYSFRLVDLYTTRPKLFVRYDPLRPGLITEPLRVMKILCLSGMTTLILIRSRRLLETLNKVKVAGEWRAHLRTL